MLKNPESLKRAYNVLKIEQTVKTIHPINNLVKYLSVIRFHPNHHIKNFCVNGVINFRENRLNLRLTHDFFWPSSYNINNAHGDRWCCMWQIPNFCFSIELWIKNMIKTLPWRNYWLTLLWIFDNGRREWGKFLLFLTFKVKWDNNLNTFQCFTLYICKLCSLNLCFVTFQWSLLASVETLIVL